MLFKTLNALQGKEINDTSLVHSSVGKGNFLSFNDVLVVLVSLIPILFPSLDSTSIKRKRGTKKWKIHSRNPIP